MPTVADAITRTKRLLNSNTRTELDAVHTEINSSATTVRLKYQTDGIRAGSYLSLGGSASVAPETVYVHSRNGEYATIQRGVDGSAAVTWAANTLIEVEPRFTEFQIYEAVKDSIRAIPNNLYAVSSAETSISTTETAVNFDISSTGFFHVLQATRSPRSQKERWVKTNVKIYRDMNTTDFASGWMLAMQEGLEKNVTVRVTYAHPFITSTLNLNTDLVSTVKMEAEMQDIPSLGAAATLMLGEESNRLDLHAMGDSRGDSALTAGDRARHSMLLQAQYDRRVSQEARRLMSLYGVRADAATSAVFPTTIR